MANTFFVVKNIANLVNISSCFQGQWILIIQEESIISLPETHDKKEQILILPSAAYPPKQEHRSTVFWPSFDNIRFDNINTSDIWPSFDNINTSDMDHKVFSKIINIQ